VSEIARANGWLAESADPAHVVIAQLIAARREQRLSQAALARRLGITQTAVSYWESGKRDVSLVDAVRWASALGRVILAADPAERDEPLPELIAGGLS
jgi:transcriptional regulator with XRE-family HTH domain